MVCDSINNNHTVNGVASKESKGEDLVKGIVLNRKQMYFLRNKPYMYNCYVSSILENLFLQKFWYRISLYVPLWIAPCTLTCVGLLINVMTCAILVYYSSDAKTVVPNWAFLVCAIGLFVYQLFDALDGKQAIKVQDTPIEEVYDHGCDAISTLFVTQSVMIATRLGNHPLMQFIFFLLPLIAFFMTHYSCHVTRVMVFGKIDVIEGQWVMIALLILTFIFGQQIWDTILFMNISLTNILFVATVLALLISIRNNALLIIGCDSPMDKYIRIPRKIDKFKWNPIFPLFSVIVFAIIGYKRNIFQTNPILFILMFGLIFAKLSFKLQIMNVSHDNLPKFDTSIIGPILLVINSYLLLIPINASIVVTLLLALLDHICYFVAVSIDMKLALDLNIFSLKYPIGHKKCRNKNYGFNMNGTENGRALNNIKTYNQLLAIVYN